MDDDVLGGGITSGDPDVLTGSRDVHDGTDGDDQRRDEWSDDLLHDERDNADDGIDKVHSADHGKQHADDPGDRRSDGLHPECGGECDVHDHTGRSDPDVLAGSRDIHDGADGDDQRHDEWSDDLLHDERDNADDGIDKVHSADHGKQHADDPGDRRSDGLHPECGGERDVHDHTGRSDPDVLAGSRDVHDGTDGDDQRRDERRDDLLHDERDNADDGIDKVHSADHGKQHADDPGDRRSDGLHPECGGERDVHDHTGRGDPDVLAGSRDIHDSADGDDQRRDEWGDDLLHDERDNADDGVDKVHSADHGKQHADDPGDRRSDGLHPECGGERDVHDHTGCGDPDVLAGSRDIHDSADGDDQRRDEWGDDLLHDERDNADDGIDKVHSADHGKQHADDPGDRRSDGLYPECGGERDVHDHTGCGDPDVLAGSRDIHDGADGDDQRRDERRDDLLHDERDNADDGIDKVHSADHGKQHADDPGDRRSDGLHPECGGERDVHDHTGRGDPDVLAGSRDIHDGADGDDQRRDEWGDDLLHDERDNADDGIDKVHSADHGKQHADDPGDRRSDGLHPECGGECDVHDHTGRSDPDVLAGSRDIHDGADGDDQRRDEWSDDLLHDERDNADDGIDKVHSADHGKRHADDPGDRRSDGLHPECGGECDVHDHTGRSDPDVLTGSRDIHDGADSDDQRRDEWSDDLLHDERDNADDGIDKVHSADHGKRHADDPGDRRSDGLHPECGGECDVHDHTGRSDPDVLTGSRDIHDGADGDDQRRDEWSDDLLHDERDNADDGIDKVHSADHGKCHADDPGDRRSDGLHPECGGECDVHDYKWRGNRNQSRQRIHSWSDGSERQGSAEWNAVTSDGWWNLRRIQFVVQHTGQHPAIHDELQFSDYGWDKPERRWICLRDSRWSEQCARTRRRRSGIWARRAWRNGWTGKQHCREIRSVQQRRRRSGFDGAVCKRGVADDTGGGHDEFGREFAHDGYIQRANELRRKQLDDDHHGRDDECDVYTDVGGQHTGDSRWEYGVRRVHGRDRRLHGDPGNHWVDDDVLGGGITSGDPDVLTGSRDVHDGTDSDDQRRDEWSDDLLHDERDNADDGIDKVHSADHGKQPRRRSRRSP